MVMFTYEKTRAAARWAEAGSEPVAAAKEILRYIREEAKAL